MPAEQRQHERRRVDFDGRLQLASGVTVACQVRDFCPGGMLVLLSDADSAAHPQARGDLVEVSIKLAAEPAGVVFRAWVARVADTGLGLAFIGPDPQAVALLTRLAEQPAPAPVAVVPEPVATPVVDRQRIVPALRERARAEARRLLELFVDDAPVWLKARGGEQLSMADRNPYMDVVAALSMHGEMLTAAFIAALEQRIDECFDPAGRDGFGGTGLSLVDKENFEQWLVLRAAASRIERDLAGPLVRLHELTSVLAGQDLDHDTDPLGPNQLGRCFESAAAALDLEESPLLHLKEAFGEILRERAEHFILGVIATLEGHGLASMARERARRRQEALAQDRREREARRAALQAAQLELGEDGEPTVTLRVPATRVQELKRRLGDGEEVRQHDLVGAITGLQRLVGSLEGLDGASTAVTTATPATAPGAKAPLSNDELAEVVERLTAQVEAVHQGGLVKALNQAHGEDAVVLSAEQANTLKTLDSLMGHLGSGGGGLGEWLQRLEGPLARMALLEDALSRDAGHPLLRILDLLDKINHPSGPEPALRKELDALLGEVEAAGDDSSRYGPVVERLEQLASAENRSFEQARAAALETIRARAGAQRSQREVDRYIAAFLARHDLPPALGQFVDSHWREVLRAILRTRGKESPLWDKGVKLLERLVSLDYERAAGRALSRDAAAALARAVASGLSLTPLDETARKKVAGAIALYLSDGGVESQERFERAVFASQDQVSSRAPDPQRPAGVERQRWEQILTQVRMLEPGQWLALHDDASEPRYFRVAAADEERHSYLLAGDSDERDTELTEGELALAVAADRAEIMERSTHPLMERTTHDMLMDMHRKLALEANHDSLTGLLNRREFERVLQHRLEEAVTRRARHTLCLFDLDMFRVTNASYGHDAGDEVLRSVGSLLRDGIDQVAECGRLGSDEFAVLYIDIPLEQGNELGLELLGALRALAVHWDDEDLRCTASMGMVELSASTESVNQLLSAAESACASAREDGGDRHRIYRRGDEETSYREDLMGLASRIGRIIRDGHLRLRCQKIEPIDKRGDRLAHYEILLGLDEAAGGQGALGKFITAAEMYGRMAEVDRWVIHNAFSWMCDNRSALDDYSGFSINISGNSFRDDRFLSFLLAEIKHSRVPTDKVIFEVTETVAIGNLRSAASLINTIKEKGCRFSLDDFGSGLSSYSYLKSLPVDYLKIDGIFVKDILDDVNDYAVVKSINEVGHFMGKRTIAEFVTNAETLDLLRDLGVDYAQGFYVEKPRFLDEL